VLPVAAVETLCRLLLRCDWHESLQYHGRSLRGISLPLVKSWHSLCHARLHTVQTTSRFCLDVGVRLHAWHSSSCMNHQCQFRFIAARRQEASTSTRSPDSQGATLLAAASLNGGRCQAVLREQAGAVSLNCCAALAQLPQLPHWDQTGPAVARMQSQESLPIPRHA
jgi:hypothetical protein